METEKKSSFNSKDLLKIILDIDQNQKYFGIIPLLPVYNYVKDDVPLVKFHELLLSLEKDRKIYLEPINDINRLGDEKKYAIFDHFRGYLYYIGLWK